MARALFLLFIAPFALIGAAQAQNGGIQVSPVLVAMSAEHNITSLRVRNGRDSPIAFEAEVYSWTQTNGQDVLIPSADIIVAPGVFEIAAGGEQIVRLGVLAANAHQERAFRIILRELPRVRQGGAVLGFLMELSLPVFIAPANARGALEARIEQRGEETVLILANTGRTHTQIAIIPDAQSETLQAPRYLLAGASIEALLPAGVRAVRLVSADIGGLQHEQVIRVRDAASFMPAGR